MPGNKVGSQTNVYVSDSVLGDQSPEDRWTAQPINGENWRPATC